MLIPILEEAHSRVHEVRNLELPKMEIMTRLPTLFEKNLDSANRVHVTETDKTVLVAGCFFEEMDV